MSVLREKASKVKKKLILAHFFYRFMIYKHYKTDKSNWFGFFYYKSCPKNVLIHAEKKVMKIIIFIILVPFDRTS
jgi:hypothetical protein